MSCYCTGACRINGGYCPNFSPPNYDYWRPAPFEYEAGWWCPKCRVTVSPRLDTCPICKQETKATLWGVPLSEWEVNGVYSGNCTNPAVFVRGGKQNE